jgi:hypothetical protein
MIDVIKEKLLVDPVGDCVPRMITDMTDQVALKYPKFLPAVDVIRAWQVGCADMHKRKPFNSQEMTPELARLGLEVLKTVFPDVDVQIRWMITDLIDQVALKYPKFRPAVDAIRVWLAFPCLAEYLLGTLNAATSSSKYAEIPRGTRLNLPPHSNPRCQRRSQRRALAKVAKAQSLRRRVPIQPQEDRECCICLQSALDQPLMAAFPCGNLHGDAGVCEQCWEEYSQSGPKSATCPLCRGEIS